MKVEHKLPAAVAAYAQRTMEQLHEFRKQYLSLLGQAKEIELQGEMLRQALGQQLAIVQESEGLPRPVAPYQLSPDCSMLTGEVADTLPITAPVAVPAELKGSKNHV
jgi:hypothetical protein